MTLTAGIYPDLSIEEYAADLMCPEPSLRSGHIKRLLTDSPAAMAAMHPRLSRWPHLLRERTRRTDEGSVAHALILGKGCDFVVAGPEDAPVTTKQGKPYRNWSGEAAEWRAREEARGVTFISREKNAAAETAKQAVWDLLTAEYGDHVIGDCEATVIWQRDTAHGPIWCRARLDLWAERFVTNMDVKTTELSVSDSNLRYMAESENPQAGMWYVQAAWQIEGLEAVKPKLAGRIDHRWPVVQVVPPFEARFFDARDGEINDWIEIGRQRNDRAANIFAKCLRDGSFPPHPRVARPRPSERLMRRMLDEEEQNG